MDNDTNPITEIASMLLAAILRLKSKKDQENQDVLLDLPTKGSVHEHGLDVDR